MSKNMELWDAVYKTNPKHTKEITFGRRYTSICAYHQIEAATKQWGPFGKDWGVTDEKFDQITSGDREIPLFRYCLYTAKLQYPGGLVELHSEIEIIHSSGKRADNYNEDWVKKVATDALTKGLSKLGFNADVFQGKFEDKYYMGELNAEFNNDGGPAQKPITPAMVSILEKMIQNRPAVSVEKMLTAMNKKFGTRYKVLAEMYQAHYEWTLISLNKYKESNVLQEKENNEQ